MSFTKYRAVDSAISDRYTELVNNPTHDLTDSENALKEVLSSNEQFDISKYVCLFSNNYTDIFTDILINYSNETRQIAHIIISSDSSPRLIEHCRFLESVRLIQLEIILTKPTGSADFKDILCIIRKNTCLISINAVNPNTGYINNIAILGERCKKYHIPLHVDVTNYINLNAIAPSLFNIDCFTVTFNLSCIHVIKRMIYEGYNLHYPVSSNVYRFVSTFIEYNSIIKNRKSLISSCPAKKEYFIKKLSTNFKIAYLTPDFVLDKPNIQIVLIATPDGESTYISSILAMSIIGSVHETNTFKQYMAENDVLVDDCGTPCKYITNAYKLPNLYSICLQYVKTSDIDKFIELLKSHI